MAVATTTAAIIGAVVAAGSAVSAAETGRLARSQADENMKNQKQENLKAQGELKQKQDDAAAVDDAKKARTAALYKQKQQLSAGREGTLLGDFNAPTTATTTKTLLGQ